MRAAVVTIPDPAAMGIAGLAGLAGVAGVASAPGRSALHLQFCSVTAPGCGRLVRAPLAPGLYATVGIDSVEPMPWGATVTWRGPGVLALDGERERTLLPGQLVTLTVRDDGPHRIDAAATLRVAARRPAQFTMSDRTTSGARKTGDT